MQFTLTKEQILSSRPRRCTECALATCIKAQVDGTVLVCPSSVQINEKTLNVSEEMKDLIEEFDLLPRNGFSLRLGTDALQAFLDKWVGFSFTLEVG